MLAVISPAKTLDFDTPARTKKFSQPQFTDQSAALIQHLRHLKPTDIANLMGISSKLADLNHGRYAQWQLPFEPTNAKAALLAFRGDVYLGLEADQYSERDYTWAQKHLRILSGLHGLLRPLDLIQPYRLEMGTRLATGVGASKRANLYEFWGDRVTQALNDALVDQQRAGERTPTLINLASQEYFNVLKMDQIDARIITPRFLDLKNGSYKFLSFFAKKARGSMASYLIKNRITSISRLRDFDSDGYAFCPERSSDDDWVFLRDNPPAPISAPTSVPISEPRST